MLDEQAPETQDQPTPEADSPEPEQEPQGVADSQEFDSSSLPPEAKQFLDKREKEMQADYTRKTQAAAEERKEAEQYRRIVEALSDPEHPQHKEALDFLGYESDQGEDEPTAEDRLARMEDYIQQSDQTKRERDLELLEDEYLDEQLSALEGKEGRQFTDDEVKVLVSYALTNRTEDGFPDIVSAHTLLSGVWDERQKNWQKSKQSPRAPGHGPPATTKFDIFNDDERLKRSAEIVEAVHQGA